MSPHLRLAILALALGACADQQPMEPVIPRASGTEAAPTREGVIVFQSNRSGNTDIWRVNADGTNLVQLTQDPSIDALPDLSPDGRSIVFQSNRGNGRFNLHVMDVDGGNVRRLTDFTSSFVTTPAWSPDGRRVAFALDGTAIGVINVDGSGFTVEARGGSFRDPDWTPNGSLVFSIGHSPADLWLLDRRGELAAVTDTLDPDHSESAVAVSPRGRRVAFARVPWFGVPSQFEIWVMDTNGTGLRQLTTGPGVDNAPAWSPDGRWILFHSHDGGGNRGLYVVPADGSEEPRLLLANPQRDAFPSWGRVRGR